MKRIALLSLCAALIAQAALGARLNPAEKRTLELKPAVVLITVHYQVAVRFKVNGSPFGFEISYDDTGSGFIYRPDGYIVTNGHVVANANRKDAAAQDALKRSIMHDIVGSVLNKIKQLTGRSITGYDSDLVQAYSIEAHFTRGPDLSVALANKKSFLGEIKAYSDPIDMGGKDVAIVKIDASNLPTVRLGDSDAAHIQEPMTVIGYPAAAGQLNMVSLESSFNPTVTNGHISAIKTDFKGTRVIQSDAVINHGNSGGPAFNDAGEVIGIATYAPAGVTGFNFFVPINTAIEFVNQVGVKPESGLFNKLWDTALATYDSGKCQGAKGKLQSVLNIMPELPDALSLMQASEKCSAEEGVVGRAMEESTWMLYSAVGLVVLFTAFLLLRRKSPAPQPAVVVESGPRIAATRPDTPPVIAPPSPAQDASFGSVQVTAGSLTGQKFKITKAGILVGTDPAKCQICVTEDAISHEHAWIVPVDNRVVVIDRGSTNGTYINSVDSPRVSKVGLQNGDRVYLGKKGSVVLTYFSS
ncbi:MAG TPA: trypsin-like peptidase domain-containing protein [Bryobacteraceae bacterium]|nr:trypsin-like peptidase domain-containing protein [Bryobacteraceae bacterium]